MRVKNIMDDTTNRGEFNRAYKQYLERKSKIHCSHCKYHKNENQTTKWYGGFNNNELRYPNWKLVSKNQKQWMYKPTKITVRNIRRNNEIFDIIW
jgi:hypothetical protein